MPALANKSYFNYGGQGPLPTPSLKAIVSSWEKIQELGPFTNTTWPFLANEIATTKAILAKHCGVSIAQIALTENVTSGCILPLWGLPLSKDERILISDCEHPGILASCIELAQRKMLNIDILKVQQVIQGNDSQKEVKSIILQSLEDSLRRNTRLVVISHILWNTGQVMPIPEIADHLQSLPNKPFLLVDAAQSFGQVPIKAAACKSDIFAFTGHKWACGPEGLGGVAISKRVIEESNPTIIGWRSLKNEEIATHNFQDSFLKDSRRFEIATSCLPLLAGLRLSLDLIEQEGIEFLRIAKIQALSKKLWDELNNIEGIKPLIDGYPPAGLVSFQTKQKLDPKKIVDQLGKENIWIRNLESPKCLRACVHITTKSEEIDILAKAIKRLLI